MNSGNAAKKKDPSLKQKFMREIRNFAMYTLFLTLFFWSFSLYRKLITDAFTISYIHFGYDFFESMFLAKIIMIGQSMKLGEKYADKPLIYPTLYKTVIFSLFVLAFGLIEHSVIDFLFGKETKPLAKIMTIGIDEILAKLLIMSFFYIIFFSFLEIGRVLGEDKLFDLFFRRKSKVGQ